MKFEKEKIYIRQNVLNKILTKTQKLQQNLKIFQKCLYENMEKHTILH